VIAIVGSYGSGKTEIAVNLAFQLSQSGRPVHLADLDLVNPYFRCREARDLLSSRGVRVVVPPGDQVWADLPIVLPEIRGLLRPSPPAVAILDVGGDDVGARALAALRPHVADGDYELWQVINAKRPFTHTVEGCLAMRAAIEHASRWRVTGLVVNTHLIDETTPAVVLEGWHLARGVRDRTGLPVRAVGVMAALAGAPALAGIDAPILVLDRHMRPPWLAEQTRVPRSEHEQNRH
jgi:hypothetical protein